MIPLRFFRDKTHVYVNNPDGTTKQMTIAEFEAMLSGEGGGDIPEYSPSNQGDVLSVDAGGDLVWKTLPPPSESVLIVHKLNNEQTSAYYLDKTYSEISTALADGKTVAVCEAYEYEGSYVYVNTGFVQLALNDEDLGSNIVYVTNSTSDTIEISLYIEADGVLTYDSMVQIPPPTVQGFVFVADSISSSGKVVYNALKSRYCYFMNGTAGTNKDYCYLPTDFGKNGSTYYVVLSNGDRYEGGETGNMTKVTVNP